MQACSCPQDGDVGRKTRPISLNRAKTKYQGHAQKSPFTFSSSCLGSLANYHAGAIFSKTSKEQSWFSMRKQHTEPTVPAEDQQVQRAAAFPGWGPALFPKTLPSQVTWRSRGGRGIRQPKPRQVQQMDRHGDVGSPMSVLVAPCRCVSGHWSLWG